MRALQYFGGTPRAMVPDNLKSAVTKARRYEPDLNRSYQEFAEHYGVAVLSARVRRSRDIAKVETSVLVVERWILARLHNRTFFSLAELNATIATLIEALNTRVIKKMPGCRRARRPRPGAREPARCRLLPMTTHDRLGHVSAHNPQEISMLAELLIIQLHHLLRLKGMAAALEQQLASPDSAGRDFEDRLGLLIQHE